MNNPFRRLVRWRIIPKAERLSDERTVGQEATLLGQL